MSRAISASYLERKLRAIVGAQGSNLLPDLEDVKGLLVLENDRPEWAFPANEMLGVRGFEAPPVVGQISFVIIENPDDSGVLAIVEDIRNQPTNIGGASNPFTVNLEFGQPLSAPPGGMTNVPFMPRDLRQWKPGASIASMACRLRDDGAAVTPMTGVPANNQLLTEVVIAGAQTSFLGEDYDSPWVLQPGTRLWLLGLVVNVRIAGNVVLRERPIEGKVEIR